MLLFPTIRIRPIPSSLKPSLARLDEFDWIIFTSRNAVRLFAQAIPPGSTMAKFLAPVNARVAAVGRGTGEELETRGVAGALVSERGDGLSLAEDIIRQFNSPGPKVLLPRSAAGLSELPDRLAAAGAVVTDISIYETVREERHSAEILGKIRSNRFDVVLFSSPSSLDSFLELAGRESLSDRAIAIGVIGKVTAGALRKTGREPDFIMAAPTTSAMIDSMTLWRQSRRTRSN